MYFDNYGLLPLDSKFPLRFFDGILPRIVETLRRCKECFLNIADNTAVYFYILCVMAIILNSFLICLTLWTQQLSDCKIIL